LNKILIMWSWVWEVKLLRWIFFLPLGYISYLSYYFLEYAWHSSDNYVYIMIFIIEFFGVFSGVYVATVTAPKGNIIIARIFFMVSIILSCLTMVYSFIFSQDISLSEILTPALNICACYIVLLCMKHNINLLDDLMREEESVDNVQHTTTIQ